MKHIRKWRRGCRCLFILLLALVLVGCLVLCSLAARVHVASAAEQPWDILLLMDYSSSMDGWKRGGDDLTQLRLEAVDLFMTYLGLGAGQSGRRLGLIHFGVESRMVMPLTAIDTLEQRESLRKALGATAPMGWTDPLQALDMAYAELFESERAAAERRHAVILLTDGHPDLPTLQTPQSKAAYAEQLRQSAARFHARNCPIFTIAVADAIQGDTDFQTVYRTLWQELAALTPPAAYYEVAGVDDAPDVYYRVAAQLLDATPRSPVITTVVQGEYAVVVDVPAGLNQIKLIVFKHDPTLQVAVYRPEGLLLHPDDPDVQHLGDIAAHNEIWAIARPREGRWRIILTGRGLAQVWQENTPAPSRAADIYRLAVLAPPAYTPAEELLTVRAILSTTHGAPLPASGIQVAMELRRAAFPEVTLLARAVGAGLYEARQTHIAPGVYTILARALFQGQEIARQERVFEAISLPRFSVISPTPGMRLVSGQPLTVTAQVLAGAKTLDWVALATIGTVTATLSGPSGMAQLVGLLPDSHGNLAAHPILSGPSGAYTLSLEMTGATDTGLQFHDDRAIPFRVVAGPPPATPFAPVAVAAASAKPLDTSAAMLRHWPALAMLAGVLGAGSGALWVYRRRPLLQGQWRVLSAPDRPIGQVVAPHNTHRASTLGAILGLKRRLAELQSRRNAIGAPEVWLLPDADAALECNGRPLNTPHCLRDGDVLAVGVYRFRYENVQQAAERRSSPPLKS